MFEIWLTFFIVLVVIELSTTNLVSIWFAIGALIAAITTIFTDTFPIQFAVFTIVSLISLVLTRSFVKKFGKKESIKTNLDRVIGKIGVVTEKITKIEPGEVKVDGKRWTAIADKTIKEDSEVKVLSIHGVKIKVKEIEEDD